ncbi:hypothetical protein M2272_001898 [Mycobacterium frederiksbergense]|uniref:Uncharacterized protein n=1 Tax=Mycolicibacterium frederiksbergense TaxID=117567 RepID=A0ABT6KX45_9MYCO|nr:hypothetical protein [Mycolicibacterium frederiksbergense]MDH6195269.1 hypothetical protein [Mycolicibacterium frederiksbergense]
MTSGSDLYSWRRVVTGGALALGLLIGAAAPMAAADPVQPTTGADAPPAAGAAAPAAPEMTADEALAIIARDYDTGSGGGQISNLIHEIMTLRSQGYRPSNANREAITKALDKRPNQTPLIDALKSTIAYQRKLQAQSSAQRGGGGFTAGINQPAPGLPANPANPNAGVFIGPSGGIQQPLG